MSQQPHQPRGHGGPPPPGAPETLGLEIAGRRIAELIDRGTPWIVSRGIPAGGNSTGTEQHGSGEDGRHCITMTCGSTWRLRRWS